MKHLIFGSYVSIQDGVYIDTSRSFNTPNKDVEFVSVPGRNGDLSFTNNRFENVEVVFNCYIKSDFEANFGSFINKLYSLDGYQRLEVREDYAIPEYFRLAQFVSATEPVTGQYNEDAQFELRFFCKPQKYFYYDESDPWTTVTSGLALNNPSYMTALPLFRVEKNGTLTISYGDGQGGAAIVLRLTVSGAPTSGANRFTDIDSELRDAYWNNINRNANISTDYDLNGTLFPVFQTKNATVVNFTGFTSVKVIPRWWKL